MLYISARQSSLVLVEECLKFSLIGLGMALLIRRLLFQALFIHRVTDTELGPFSSARQCLHCIWSRLDGNEMLTMFLWRILLVH